MRTRVWYLLLVILVVPALMGCGFLTMIGLQPENDTKPAPAQKPPVTAPSAGGSAAPVTPAAEEPEEQSLYGTWTGTVQFTKYTLHLPDAESRAAFEPGIASTVGPVYSVEIDVYSDTEATMTFDSKTTITGSLARDGDSVTFVFRKAGDDNFEVGASPPVTFTFTGAIESSPTRAMAGAVLYEVFTKDGGPAWTQNGEWIVTPE